MNPETPTKHMAIDAEGGRVSFRQFERSTRTINTNDQYERSIRAINTSDQTIDANGGHRRQGAAKGEGVGGVDPSADADSAGSGLGSVAVLDALAVLDLVGALAGLSRAGLGFPRAREGASPPPALNAALRQKRHEEIGLCWAPGLAVRGGSLAVLDLTVQNGFLPAQEIHGSPR